jgi:hypothetical protein
MLEIGGTMRLAVFALLFVGLLTSCGSVDPLQLRFEAEYDWDRPGDATPEHNVWVIYPVWLADEDRPTVLRVVDEYVNSMQRAYPWSKDNISWDLFEVFIHNSWESFVSAPPPAWCRGWIYRYKIAVAWDVTRDEKGKLTGLSRQNCLTALPHEIMHAILRERYGAHGHELFKLEEIKEVIAQCKSESPTITIRPETDKGAFAYRYDPWTIPTYGE